MKEHLKTSTARKDSKDNSLINNEAAKRKKLVKQSISEMNRK